MPRVLFGVVGMVGVFCFLYLLLDNIRCINHKVQPLFDPFAIGSLAPSERGGHICVGTNQWKRLARQAHPLNEEHRSQFPLGGMNPRDTTTRRKQEKSSSNSTMAWPQASFNNRGLDSSPRMFTTRPSRAYRNYSGPRIDI